MHKPDIMRPAVLGGLIGAVLSLVPPLCVLNCCCCLNYILSGVIAGAMYARAAEKLRWMPGAGEGASTGAIAGLIAGAISGAVNGIVDLGTRTLRSFGFDEDALLIGRRIGAVLHETIVGAGWHESILGAGANGAIRTQDLHDLLRWNQHWADMSPFAVMSASVGTFLVAGLIAGAIGGMIGVAMFRRDPGTMGAPPAPPPPFSPPPFSPTPGSPSPPSAAGPTTASAPGASPIPAPWPAPAQAPRAPDAPWHGGAAPAPSAGPPAAAQPPEAPARTLHDGGERREREGDGPNYDPGI